MAKMFFTDGSESEVRPSNGKSFTLKEMQDLVAGGGNIEMMKLDGNMTLVFDEEGKLKELPYNADATKMVTNSSDLDSFGPPGSWSSDLGRPCDFIVGDALLLSPGQK